MSARTAPGGGAVADRGGSGADHLPRRPGPLSPGDSLGKPQVDGGAARNLADDGPGTPGNPAIFAEEGASDSHENAFLRACDAAEWLKNDAGGYLPRYAANVALGRTLAARMDFLQANDFMRADDKPDTTTASQYLKCLEALRLTPASAARGGARLEQAKPAAESALDSFRRRQFRAVGR